MAEPAWWRAVRDTAGTRFAGDGAAGTVGSAPGGWGALSPYREAIQTAAQRYRLDPSLLAGVVDVESSGQAGAVNRSSGATGLGQVMPREAGFPDRPTRQELLDPATNLDWSARILAQGRDRYGSEAQGLAAYLGAIGPRGAITGARDAMGTGANAYIQRVRGRQTQYRDAAGAAQGAVAPAPYAREAVRPAEEPGQPAWWAAVRTERQEQGRAPTISGPASDQPAWVGIAASQLGKPYIWGSAGGRSRFDLQAPGYDCSGYVSMVYRNAFGVDLPAFTGSAYPATKPVAPGEAQPGDLVFWNMNQSDPRLQHVAIYLGDGKVIQSGGAGDGVNVAPVTQMAGAEFRRNPQAYQRYGSGPGSQSVPGNRVEPTVPTASAGRSAAPVTLQGTQAPAWWAAVR